MNSSETYSMINIFYSIFKKNNYEIEPYDVKHMTANLYDERNDNAFIFDNKADPYADCSHICAIHTSIEEDPVNGCFNYYSETGNITDAARFLQTLGYEIKELPQTCQEAQQDYDNDVRRLDEQYINAIKDYLQSDNSKGFPVNGYMGLACENWFRMQPNGYVLRYELNGKPCEIVNDTFAWGDWSSKYALLRRYIAEHGPNVPSKDCIVCGVNISIWVGDQRTAYRKGYLSKERQKLLEDIGFSLNTYNDAWDEMFNLLLEYKDEHGNMNIPKRDKYKGKTLGTWCQHQRDDYKTGEILPERYERLKEIGFDFDPLETEWMRRYEQYKRYIASNKGNAYISRRTDFEGEHLGAWVETQRKRVDKLSPKRKKLLRDIGMEI